MFKGIKTAIAVALSIGGLGTAVTLSAVAATPHELRQANASVTSGDLFFVDISGQTGWKNDGAYIAVYFFNSDSDHQWVSSASKSAYTGNIYQFTVPGSNKTWSNAIAVRLNSSSATPNWDNKWNKTNDISLGNNNGIKITGWDSGEAATFNGIDSGTQFYANYNSASWWNTGSDQYMYFFDAQDGSAAVWQPMYDVHEARKTDNTGNDLILECTVPNNTTYYGAIAVRIKSGMTPSFDNKEQQSVDYKPVSESDVNNAIVLGDGGWGKPASITSSYSIGDEQRAKWYGYYFLSETNSNCGSKTAPSSSVWSELETEYSHMPSGAQSIVKNADASKYDAGTANDSYEEAIRRYDLIVSLRGSSNFMNRSIQTLGSARIVSVKNDYTSVLVIVSSSILLVSFGAFFLLHKKRKQY